MAQAINEWTGEETFKNRCRLTTMGTTLLQKHDLGLAFFYARDNFNARSGSGNEVIFVCSKAGYDFYRISTCLITNQEEIKGYFRVTYTIRRDKDYNRISHRMSDDNEDRWTRAMRNVPKIRDKLQRDLDEVNIAIQERQAREALERRARELQREREDLNVVVARVNPQDAEIQRAREVRNWEREQARHQERIRLNLVCADCLDDECDGTECDLPPGYVRSMVFGVKSKPREEDLNDAFSRGQAELRREREMMAEFIAPPPSAQLDLVSTPIPFIPEQPPNA
jgi:hypothetical protein